MARSVNCALRLDALSWFLVECAPRYVFGRTPAHDQVAGSACYPWLLLFTRSVKRIFDRYLHGLAAPDIFGVDLDYVLVLLYHLVSCLGLSHLLPQYFHHRLSRIGTLFIPYALSFVISHLYYILAMSFILAESTIIWL